MYLLSTVWNFTLLLAGSFEATKRVKQCTDRGKHNKLLDDNGEWEEKNYPNVFRNDAGEDE